MIKSITISPYKENSSFGEKARWVVSSLDRHDGLYNTNCCIYREDESHNLFRSSKIESPDFCIQYVKPLDFVKTPYKNIGIFEPTLKGFPYQENVMRLLDNIVVYSENQKKAMPESLRHKCLVVRPTMSPVESQQKMKKIFSKFNLYTSALDDNTNVDMIIMAYLSSFTINDNIRLTILCDNPQELTQHINKTQETLGLYERVPLYPEIALQTDMSVHGSCHCFVDASMGYDISIHTMLSVAYSNPVITSGSDGLFEWVDEEVCYKFESYEGCRNSCLVGNVPNYLSLKRSLLEAFENRDLFNDKQAKMIDGCHTSFYTRNKDTIGDVLCSLL